MTIRSFEEMLEEYHIEDLDSDDKEERTKMLSLYKHSVIFEGDFLEIDNIQKWILQHLEINSAPYLFYGKLGYDYGFFEFFFPSQTLANKFAEATPTIFTTYPNGKTLKTAGLGKFIEA